MEDGKCVACGNGPTRIVIEDQAHFGVMYRNQMHAQCDHCGFEGVNGTMMKHNEVQPTSEIAGPFKEIEVTDIHYTDTYFNWSWQGVGFGQLSFKKDADGQIRCMNECMGPNSVRKILYAFVDKLVADMILEEQ